MADGGTDYLRYGAADMKKIEIKAFYTDDPFELVRQHATRGGRGKDGKQPLKWVPLCEMSDKWLESVLDYGGEDWHIDLIQKEIAYRKEKCIKIEES
jgi:hypothetical protein